MRYLLLSSCKEGVLEGVKLRGEALGGREGRRGEKRGEEQRGGKRGIQWFFSFHHPSQRRVSSNRR